MASSTVQPTPITVLAVDDDSTILRLVQTHLKKVGFEVLTAPNGAVALETIKERMPDLVVLDVQMPEMDGFEVLRRLRRNAMTARLPVIMFTAMDAERDVNEGWALGADVYVTKPFQPDALLTAVNSVLESAATSSIPTAASPPRPSGAPLPMPPGTPAEIKFLRGGMHTRASESAAK